MFGTWHRDLSTEQLVERLPAALASGEPGPDGALPLKSTASSTTISRRSSSNSIGVRSRSCCSTT